jgi:hypothetical protein
MTGMEPWRNPTPPIPRLLGGTLVGAGPTRPAPVAIWYIASMLDSGQSAPHPMGWPPGVVSACTPACASAMTGVIACRSWNGWSGALVTKQGFAPNGEIGKSSNAPAPNCVSGTAAWMPGMTVPTSEFCRLAMGPPIEPVVSMLTNTSIALTSVLNVSGFSCGPAGSS